MKWYKSNEQINYIADKPPWLSGRILPNVDVDSPHNKSPRLSEADFEENFPDRHNDTWSEAGIRSPGEKLVTT